MLRDQSYKRLLFIVSPLQLLAALRISWNHCSFFFGPELRPSDFSCPQTLNVQPPGCHLKRICFAVFSLSLSWDANLLAIRKLRRWCRGGFAGYHGVYEANTHLATGGSHRPDVFVFTFSAGTSAAGDMQPHHHQAFVARPKQGWWAAWQLLFPPVVDPGVLLTLGLFAFSPQSLPEFPPLYLLQPVKIRGRFPFICLWKYRQQIGHIFSSGYSSC